jgi:hypothetical protein
MGFGWRKPIFGGLFWVSGINSQGDGTELEFGGLVVLFRLEFLVQSLTEIVLHLRSEEIWMVRV